MRWLCEALGVSRSGFHAWLSRSPSARARSDEALGAKVKASFVGSDRTYGARRVWHDVLAEGAAGGLHRVGSASTQSEPANGHVSVNDAELKKLPLDHSINTANVSI